MAIDVNSLLVPGTAVEVSNLFTGTWSSGFRVVGREPGGYRLARQSDGSELPALFSPVRLRLVGRSDQAMAGVGSRVGVG
ncbi:MAG: hypothetical protein QOK43_1139 [Acidimicrobiaceae bacterium]|jgi:hypothetical protein|nr:hypothetical protein [Acidimicrobiaceae bacterium]MDQ1444170.1 hypothetical protein [Acidimicrobiaceae bacterium]